MEANDWVDHITDHNLRAQNESKKHTSHPRAIIISKKHKLTRIASLAFDHPNPSPQLYIGVIFSFMCVIFSVGKCC